MAPRFYYRAAQPVLEYSFETRGGVPMRLVREQADTLPAEDRIVAWLIDAKRLDDAGLQRARSMAEVAHEGLLSVLPRLGLVTETELALAYAGGLGLPFIAREAMPSDPVLPEQLTYDFLAAHRAVPLGFRDGALEVAIADPFSAAAIDGLRFATGVPVTIAISEPSVIEEAVERLYGGSANRLSAITKQLSADAPQFRQSDVDRVRDESSEAPIIRFANAMIERAIEARASDIHIEPFENGLRVRYRVDGRLRDVENLSAGASETIQSRIKIMAQLDIAERRLPQDGRMRLSVRGRVMDFRVAVTPTVHGESIVIRILDPAAARLVDSDLGFEDEMLVRFRRLLAQPHGIVLVTGPTGSGKTTTLYAALNALNTGDRKILTAEDPVEYLIDGVNQTHVRPDIKYDFAAALRSFLRQDPDVLMVGEIRDAETAHVAVRAALTGHLVLSSLHTNDAASAFARLLDMGVEDFLIASTLNGIVAQRLVRRLCAKCRRLAPLPALLKDRFAKLLGPVAERGAYTAVGCSHCDGTGYCGRLAIAELLAVSDRIRGLCARGISASDVAAAARIEGMQSMLEDGLSKVVRGDTTLEEVLRVTMDA